MQCQCTNKTFNINCPEHYLPASERSLYGNRYHANIYDLLAVRGWVKKSEYRGIELWFKNGWVARVPRDYNIEIKYYRGAK